MRTRELSAVRGLAHIDMLGIRKARQLLPGQEAVDPFTPVAEAAEIRGPEVYHRLDPCGLVVG